MDMDIGFFLKRIRGERGYTLKEVAAGVGLTPSLVSQIENGKASPSLNSLNAILKYYKMELADFFKQVEQKDYIFVSKTEVETIKNEASGVSLSLLASKLQNNAIESYLVHLMPNSKAVVIPAFSKKHGERTVCVLNGEAEVSLDDETIHMDKGDSLNFKSYLKCCVLNISLIEICELLITGAPGIF